MASNSSRPQPSRGYSAPFLSRSSTSSSNTDSSSSSASPTTHHYPQQPHTRTKTDEPDYFSAQAPSSSLASPTQFHIDYNSNSFASSSHQSNTNNAFTNAFNAAYYGTSPNNSNSNSYTYTTHSAGPTAPYPIITATITSRHPPPSTSNRSTPEEEEDSNSNSPYSQFAMHIPGPPTTLSLGGVGGRSSTHQHQRGGPQVMSSSSHHHRSQTHQQQPLPSPLDRTRRMPPPSSRSTPQMQVTSSVYAYTLSVQLPKAIQPEMVTVCANKGDKIKVVADVWHLEDESHYEWQIAFPPYDIDMGNVHARFDDSRNLTIDVRRVPRIYR